MHFRECVIENVGPIKFLDIRAPIDNSGLPKPLILVGKNGSGKTILLSYIADALTEFAKAAFTDIVPHQPNTLIPYFRMVSATSQRTNSDFGIALLEFSSEGEKLSYVEKTGTLDPSTYAEKILGRFEQVEPWATEGNHKAISQDKQVYERAFVSCAICYFPPSRKESPHWLNPTSIVHKAPISFGQTLSGELGKPIFIESSAEENKRWLFDVYLDSMVGLEVDTENKVQLTRNIANALLLRQSRINAESLLKSVLQDDSAEFVLNYRHQSAYRLAIKTADGTLIPSLDHLSSGQAILFNLFTTIIRYADRADINKSIALHQIEGLVLIDEIDAHLHGELQYRVLPNLLKLFPKVQFVVTTHAPLFLLGMKEVFEDDGFQIIEMPDGEVISTERFSEFANSYEYYKRTKTYEEDIKQRVLEGSKPLALTEGETDPLYIRTALELLNRGDLLEAIDIEWIGARKIQGAFNSGKDALNAAKNFFEANPALLNRKLLLLYDCDTHKPSEKLDNLVVRSLPKNEANTLIKAGIENLLPQDIFDRKFYSEKTKASNYGEVTTIQQFQKTEFCKWICEERREPGDFEKFSVAIEILSEFLSS